MYLELEEWTIKRLKSIYLNKVVFGVFVIENYATVFLIFEQQSEPECSMLLRYKLINNNTSSCKYCVYILNPDPKSTLACLMINL